MESNRRDFLSLLAAGAATGVAACNTARATASPPTAGSRRKIKAVVFDAFPIFDPRPIFGLTEEVFPEKGVELANVWRTRQFEYTWLRTVSGRYADFWKVTEDALVFAAATVKVDLDADKRARLMNAYLSLKAWPDVVPSLTALKAAGIRMGFLSNLTGPMLQAAIRSAGLDGMFEHVLSTDQVKTYKPDPRAYQIGLDAFGLPRDEMAFVAFAGWDAIGAKWFGYPTFWVNRVKTPREEMGVTPDITASDLQPLPAFVNGA
jgi:2-haloacid dehalogenase